MIENNEDNIIVESLRHVQNHATRQELQTCLD